MANCLYCSNNTLCNQCSSTKYLRSDKSGCINSCLNDTNSIKLIFFKVKS